MSGFIREYGEFVGVFLGMDWVQLIIGIVVLNFDYVDNFCVFDINVVMVFFYIYCVILELFLNLFVCFLGYRLWDYCEDKGSIFCVQV